MGTIFGFDLGTTSVGFAVVANDTNGNPTQLLRMGTRVFEETRAARKLETKNKERRAARLLRRQLRRRKWRRIHLGRALSDAGLLPEFGGDEWHQLMLTNPYELRARALNEPLEPFAIGRAMYHLAKRRGFRFPRPEEEAASGDEEETKERGVVREGIQELRQQMGSRTLGAYLATQHRKRGKHLHIDRRMIEAEFDLIWDSQAPHHRHQLTPEVRDRLWNILFHHRPTFWRVKTLGQCRLMPGEPLCHTGSWIGQQFIMLKELNNLRLTAPEPRELEPEERTAALVVLQSQATATFGSLRKALKLRGVRFNYEDGKAKHMHGNATEAALAGAFGAAWGTHPAKDRIRREIVERLWTVNYNRVGNKRIEIRSWQQREAERASFIRAAQADWGLTRDLAESLSELHLPVGWLRFSEAAIRKLVPRLEQGAKESEALDAEFPHHRDAPLANEQRLPSTQDDLPDIRNPTVTRTLNELRKVTNNLVRAHGKPDLIRIELARDLKQPPSRRLQIQRDNQAREQQRKKAVAALQERGVHVSGLNIEKWLLWQECQETSPYTGNKIGFDGLFNRGDFQVDHIWPQSRSFDNNVINKVVCESHINREKGNRTPLEYLEQTGGDVEEFKRRVKNLGLPEPKVKRLLSSHLEMEGSDELAERQLRDSSYTAVAARQFLGKLGVPVATTNGRVTAHLARQWGLYAAAFGRNTKDRNDLRHHAVDALTVALSSPAIVKRLSDHYKQEMLGNPPRFAPPWPTLWHEARAWAEKMVVSHRVQRKVSGPLHAENSWRRIGPDPEDANYDRYGIRKPLDQIKSEVPDIPDPVVRGYVAHLKEGGNTENAPDLGFPAPHRTRVHIKKQSSIVVPLRDDKPIVAEKADNHHMALYGRNGKMERFCLVSLFDATKRLAAGDLVVAKWIETEDAERVPLLFSLARGDLLELKDSPDTPRYVVVRGVWDSGQVELSLHRAATRDIWRRPNAKSLIEKYGARKIAVDPIGRVRYPRD